MTPAPQRTLMPGQADIPRTEATLKEARIGKEAPPEHTELESEETSTTPQISTSTSTTQRARTRWQRERQRSERAESRRTTCAHQSWTDGTRWNGTTAATCHSDIFKSDRHFSDAACDFISDEWWTPSTPSPAEAKLKAFMGVLKKNGTGLTGLPGELAAVMKDNKVTEGLQKIQGMHDAVENLGEAQQRFKQACFARGQNLALWRQFLHLSGLRWQEHTQQFQSQERHNLEQISQARNAVKNAQAIFRDLKERGVTTTDAEGNPAMMGDTIMGTESPIEDGLQHLTESLGEFSSPGRSRTCCCRRATEEETAQGRDAGGRTHGLKALCAAIYAAFWQGSQWMTCGLQCGLEAFKCFRTRFTTLGSFFTCSRPFL